MRHRTLAVLTAMLLAGCHSVNTGVRLQADPAAISSLAGDWSGEYWGGVGGRSGSLAFSLRSGSDSLYGDVLMHGGSGQLLVPAEPIEQHRTHVRMPERLRIDFVIVRADSVRGTLEPYVAPECACTVGTTFLGAVRDDRMSGTFETRHEGRVLATGRWAMRRASGGR